MWQQTELKHTQRGQIALFASSLFKWRKASQWFNWQASGASERPKGFLQRSRLRYFWFHIYARQNTLAKKNLLQPSGPSSITVHSYSDTFFLHFADVWKNSYIRHMFLVGSTQIVGSHPRIGVPAAYFLSGNGGTSLLCRRSLLFERHKVSPDSDQSQRSLVTPRGWI